MMDKVECESSKTLSKRSKTDEDEEDEIHRPVDVLPHEIVLSFDHILDQIFSYLETPDLLTCRLVSHRFLKFAKAPLGKKLELQFDNYVLEFSDSLAEYMEPTEKTLEKLTTFLEQSFLSSSRESNAKLISFPCTCFQFYRAQLGQEVLQYFLSINGSNIRKLSIYVIETGTTHENVLMHQISRLLTIQAPHMEHLVLWSMQPKVEWQQGVPFEIQDSINENTPSRSECSPLLQTDPEFQQIISRVGAFRNKSCLKVLEVNGEGLAKVLELIFQISPKLQEVFMYEDSYMYLLHPVNRVYLLKRLKLLLEIDYHNSNRMKIMEMMLIKNNLRLKKFGIDFDAIVPLCGINSEFEKSLVSIINRILEQSRDTLKSFALSSKSFLLGMKLPSSMPQLRKLRLDEYEKRHDINATVFFSKGFSLSKTFPNLTCVKINNFVEPIKPDEYYEFLNFLDFQGGDDPTLSLSVKKVVLLSSCFDDTETEDMEEEEGALKIPEFISQRVQKHFPNARVEAR